MRLSARVSDWYSDDHPCVLHAADAQLFDGKSLEIDSDGEVVYKDEAGRVWRVQDQVVINAERNGRWTRQNEFRDPRIFARWARSNGDASLFPWLIIG